MNVLEELDISVALAGSLPPCPPQLQSDLKLKAITGRINALDAEMFEQLTHLRRALQTLEVLEKERCDAVSDLKSEISIKTARPFNEMPSELISDVLVYAAHGSANPFYLCHIDRRIRGIAFSSPGVWQNIHILNWKFALKSVNLLAWAQRSMHLPIMVTCCCERLPQWQKFAEAVHDRLESLEFLMCSSFNPLRTSEPFNWPLLKRLTLYDRRASRQGDNSDPRFLALEANKPFMTFAHAPKLVDLFIHLPIVCIRLEHFHVPWENLQTLHLNSCDDIMSLRHILSRCTQLQTLDICFIATVTTTVAMPFSLPSLVTLSLEGSSLSRDLPWFLHAGLESAPKLEYLSVRIPYDHNVRTILTPLSTFLQRIQPALKSLALEVSVLSPHAVSHLHALLRLPSISAALQSFKLVLTEDPQMMMYPRLSGLEGRPEIVQTMKSVFAILAVVRSTPDGSRTPSPPIIPKLDSLELQFPHSMLFMKYQGPSPPADDTRTRAHGEILLSKIVRSRAPQGDDVSSLIFLRVWVTDIVSTPLGLRLKKTQVIVPGVGEDIQGIPRQTNPAETVQADQASTSSVLRLTIRPDE